MYQLACPHVGMCERLSALLAEIHMHYEDEQQTHWTHDSPAPIVRSVQGEESEVLRRRGNGVADDGATIWYG